MVEQSSFCPDKLLIAIGAFIVLSSILLFSKANDIFKSFFVIASAFLILAENIQFPSFLWHNSTSFIDDKYIHYYIRTSIYTFRCLRQFVTGLGKNKEIVGVKVEEEDAREIAAEYDDKEFVIDNKGYFLIRVNREVRNIEAAFCKEKNKVALKITGKKPIDIYHAIINKEKLPIRKDQCAYLGRELQKAYIALKNDLEYVQD